ncbi:hypothetical protein QZQ97_22345 [Serratia sp. root2]|uniref:hypothetical protein n=1 Tax=Serratia sp. root2 TaxID=3059676 RepID=UPI002890CB18|nr:hypothetical protein [Serratia sp. root2]MDT3253659.1 hypothetical protein [Serratia sp. root2]
MTDKYKKTSKTIFNKTGSSYLNNKVNSTKKHKYYQKLTTEIIKSRLSLILVYYINFNEAVKNGIGMSRRIGHSVRPCDNAQEPDINIPVILEAASVLARLFGPSLSLTLWASASAVQIGS